MNKAGATGDDSLSYCQTTQNTCDAMLSLTPPATGDGLYSQDDIAVSMRLHIKEHKRTVPLCSQKKLFNHDGIFYSSKYKTVTHCYNIEERIVLCKLFF